jgi:DNA-directed RNA polymerase subunit H (RpoH/RPB5)
MERHYLECEHRRLTPGEAKDFLRAQGLKLHQMPAIFDSDPALGEVRPAVGDIIEITRPANGAFPAHRFYRRVVSGW